MTHLVVNLSSGKGTWGHVSRLIKDQEWEKVFVLTNDFGKANFKVGKEYEKEFILLDARKSILELVEDIRKSLDGKIKDTEVALNIVSGTGREHMAILSALLKLGLGVRLVALTRDGIKEI
jgi:hypothetical protein